MNGDADKKLDREGTGERMYSYEERKKAVEAYIKNECNARQTVKELGYPTRPTLVNWYWEVKRTGRHKEKFERAREYSEEQRREAVEYYFAHGMSLTKTIRKLALPIKRDALRNWIKEFEPERELNCKRSMPLVQCTQEQKEEAVAAVLCTQGKTGQEIAEEYGVSRPAVYKWRRRFLAREGDMAMPGTDEERKALEEKNAELVRELQRARRELEETEKRLYRARMECDVLEKVAEVLKKEKGADPRKMGNREKAAVIGALRNKYSLKELLELLDIAKSSYEYQASALRAPDKYEELRRTIREEFQAGKGCYGYRRIHAKLKVRGRTVSEKVIRRLMREEQLVVLHARRKRYNSYMGEISPAVENIIQRDFHADRPNVKWLTDITEFDIPAGKVYLSPIIDCFDGMAVSWTIGTHPNANLVNSMLDQAVRRLAENEHPVVHSDRGGHYRWPGWIRRMEQAGLTRSMSKKGCSPDNSACEGFFGRLKNEMFYGRSWEGVSIPEFIHSVDDYMRWYNEDRIKLSLGALSPVAYRHSLGFTI